MTLINKWEDFEKAATTVYSNNTMNTRFVLKYTHSKHLLEIKLTDNAECLRYKAQMAHDVKKLEKFVSKLMKNMASQAK